MLISRTSLDFLTLQLFRLLTDMWYYNILFLTHSPFSFSLQHSTYKTSGTKVEEIIQFVPHFSFSTILSTVLPSLFKLVRDSEQDILIKSNLTTANSSGNLHSLKSTNPPITASPECLLDDLPTSSGFLLNTH